MTVAAPPDTDRLRNVLEESLGSPFVEGNQVHRLKNGDEIFPAMLEAIDRAQARVDFLTFVYWEGDIAERFASALARRASDGLQVRVLLDAFGAGKMPAKLVEVMRTAGADVRYFRPIRARDALRLTNRTHRKILVCDSDVAFTGGVGIASEWEGDARRPGEWRDSHFRVRGPAVALLRAGFLENWYEAAGHMPSAPEPTPTEARGNSLVQVVRSSGGAAWCDIRTVTLTVLNSAQTRIRIATAYFVPDEEVTESLRGAVGRGVEVDVLLPGRHTDERLCNLAAEKEMERLVEAGVDVRLYQRTMLHCKVLLADDELAVVGSPNMNMRSMRRDDEIAMLVLDRDLVATLDRDLEEDRAHAEPFASAEWNAPEGWRRVQASVARRLRRAL